MTKPIGLQLSFAGRIGLAMAGALALAAPILVGLLDTPVIRAQSPEAARPNFEVASVKPCRAQPYIKLGGGDSSPGRLSTGCDLLADDTNQGLIQRAYVRFAGGHTNPFGILPIKGGPKWIHSELYRIDAKAEGHPSMETMMGPMLQTLLEDRFKLKIRRVTSEGPVYALTSTGETRLKPFTEGSCVPMPLAMPAPTPPPGKRFCQVRMWLQNPSIEAEGSTLTEFSKWLDRILDRPVIDKTGITGKFDIHLEFSRDLATPGLPGLIEQPPGTPTAPTSDPTRPTIFTAIQEQLGLKLTPARGPVESLVIDHIERPSAN